MSPPLKLCENFKISNRVCTWEYPKSKSAYAFGPPVLLVGKARKPNFNNSTLVVMYHNILMHVNVGIYYKIMSVPQNNVTHLDNVMMVSYASIKVG